MSQAEKFLADVNRFIAKTGMKATVFGRSAVNDPNFVGDLRKGRKPNLGVVDRVYGYMREKAPAARRGAA